MISEKTISKIVRSLEEYGKIIGIRELAELSGVAEITIKVNIKSILNNPHVTHTQTGKRNTYTFGYLRNPKPTPKELKSLLRDFTQIESNLHYVNNTVKGLKGKVIHDSILYSTSNLCSEIIIESDNLMDKMMEYSIRDKEKLTGRIGLKYKMELLSEMRLKIHQSSYKISPSISKKLLSNLQLSRNKKIVRTMNYPYY